MPTTHRQTLHCGGHKYGPKPAQVITKLKPPHLKRHDGADGPKGLAGLEVGGHLYKGPRGTEVRPCR
jgi:hypothetical protein